MVGEETRSGWGDEPPDVDECIRAGMYWFDRGDFEAAEAWWRRSLELAPDSEDVKQCLARLPALSAPIDEAPADIRFEPEDEAETDEAFDVSDRLILDEFTDLSGLREDASSPVGSLPANTGAAVPGLDVKPGWLMPSWLPRPAEGRASAPDLQPTELDLTGRATEPDGALTSPWDEGPATTNAVTVEDASALDAFDSFDPFDVRDERDLRPSYAPREAREPPASREPRASRERTPEAIAIEAPAWPDDDAFQQTTPHASEMGHYEMVGQGAVEMTGELARAFGRPWARSASHASHDRQTQPPMNSAPMFEVVPVPASSSTSPSTSTARSTAHTLPPPEPKGPPLWDALLRGAKDRFALHDFAGALDLLERILAESGLYDERPAVFSEARTLMEEVRAQLLKIFSSKVGSLESVPRVVLSKEEIIWLNLNHRAGFILSQIDGSVTCDDLIALSGMSRLDTLRILTELLQQGVIDFRRS